MPPTPAAATATTSDVGSAQTDTQAATTNTSTSAPSPSYTWDVTGKASDGSTESGEVQLWSPIKAADFQPWSGWPASDCTPDPQRDAVIPIALSVTSTTSGFATTVNISVDSVVETASVQLTMDNTDEKNCQVANQSTESQRIGVASSGQVAAGGGATEDAYLIAPDYYSPAHPDGDPSLLNSPIDISGITNSDGAFQFTGTGPGICNDTSTYTSYVMLNGTKAQSSPYSSCA